MNARTVKGTGKGTATVVARPFNYRGRGLYCDGVSLEGLAEAHGTPLYVYSAEQIRYRFGLFQEAFAGREDRRYAVKANSSLAILWMLAELGAGFDIVSGGELERVRRADKAALKRVVFSGAGKQEWEIDAALQARILMFNVESEAELALLAARAEALGVRARFALRVNPDVFAETHPYISTGLGSHKFGVEIGLARAIYRRAARSKWLDAAGVSVHIGSQIRAVGPFASALERVAGLVNELREDGHKIRFVDAGGGLGINDNDRRRSRSSMRRARCGSMRRRWGRGCGIRRGALAGGAGAICGGAGGRLLTRVVVVKRTARRRL